jgi:hypothetical protein
VVELDGKVEAANRNISTQQAKLTRTNELVTAMFSKGLTEYFSTTQGNMTTFLIRPKPGGASGAIVLMLLNSAPIFQTIQLQFHIYTQPKASYALSGNVLAFSWGDPVESLKQFPFEVSYVPDPTYHGAIYSALSVKDGHALADGTPLPF